MKNREWRTEDRGQRTRMKNSGWRTGDREWGEEQETQDRGWRTVYSGEED